MANFSPCSKSSVARGQPSNRILVTGVLLAFLLEPGVAHAGAWVPEPGRGYAKLWAKYFWGYDYIDGDGRTHPLAGYHELFVSTYGEVGIHGPLGAWWHTDIARIFTLVNPRTADREAHVGVGDPAFGLRLQALRLDRFRIAVEAGVRAPLADDEPQDDVISDKDGEPMVGELRIGAGVWDAITSLAFGYGFDHGYLAASGGYTVRTGGFDDVVTFTAEGGGRLFHDRWKGRIRVTGHLPIDDGDAPRTDSPSGIGNGTSYIGFALEVDYQLVERWFLGLTVEGGLGLLRRLAGGPVVSLSAATRF